MNQLLRISTCLAVATFFGLSVQAVQLRPELEVQLRPRIRVLALELAMRYPEGELISYTDLPIHEAERVDRFRLALMEALRGLPVDQSVINLATDLLYDHVLRMGRVASPSAAADALFEQVMRYLAEHGAGHELATNLQQGIGALRIDPRLRKLRPRFERRLRDLVTLVHIRPNEPMQPPTLGHLTEFEKTVFFDRITEMAENFRLATSLRLEQESREAGTCPILLHNNDNHK